MFIVDKGLNKHYDCFLAAQNGKAEEVSCYLDSHPELLTSSPCNKIFTTGRPPKLVSLLDIAVLNGHVQTTEELISRGALLSKDILKLATLSPAMQQALQRVKYAKNGRPPSIDTPIRALREGKNEVAKWILHDPNCLAAKFDGILLLEQALWYHPVLVVWLAEQGAVWPNNPLGIVMRKAYDSRYAACLAVLVDYGYCADREKNSKALIELINTYHAHSANDEEREACTKMLISLVGYGIDSNYYATTFVRRISIPLLHYAAEKWPEILPQLIGIGVDINTCDKNGFTVMHRIACMDIERFTFEKYINLFNLLKTLNASPIVRAQNQTPYQMAITKNNNRIARAIKEYTCSKDDSEICHGSGNTIAEQDQQLEERRQSDSSEQALLERINRLEARLLPPPVQHAPLTATQYDPNDIAMIKAMAALYVNCLSEHPRQVPYLLQKACVPEIITEVGMREIANRAFVGIVVDDDSKEECINDLITLNELANTSPQLLRLKSDIRYRQHDIAKIVYDTSLAATLECQPMMGFRP